MVINSLIKKFEYKIEQHRKEISKLNEKYAAYWLLIGKTEALGDSIVSVIEEYALENELSVFQKNKLRIYKLK